MKKIGMCISSHCVFTAMAAQQSSLNAQGKLLTHAIPSSFTHQNLRNISMKKEINFDIDGIVYKIDDFKLQKRLGNVANAPRWAIAHKFSSNNSLNNFMVFLLILFLGITEWK